jgi:hypothetical protein
MKKKTEQVNQETKKYPTRGVLLLAIGHPNYGHYAHQLCISIKSVDPSIKVACAHAEGALSHVITYHKFDQLIDVPTEMINSNGLKDYMKAKTHLYDLSPFDETIYIDSDVIWCPQKPIANLFNELQDVNFTMSNRGKIEIEKALKGFIHWADPEQIREKFNIKSGWLINLASEFMYFKKSPPTKELFDRAKKIFDKPLIDFTRFGHSMPDELAFEIAMLQMDMYPHITPFIPFYWEHFEKKNLAPKDIYPNYYAISMGGNMNVASSEELYNNLAQHYGNKFGLGFFPARHKRGWLPERTNI